MPSVCKGSKVLVSGANGYIAMWVVRTLLERGFTVRGTVRTEDRGKFIIAYFESLGYGDKLEMVVVDDIAEEGAFDEAVKGVDAIEHIASPCHFSCKAPDEFITPAVQGTLGILKSALKTGSQVQRIVITSSYGAVGIICPSQPTVFSERDWNDLVVEEVREIGDKSSPMAMYCASKTLAEKAAWDFHAQHKPQVKWDLVVINPPFVYGPPIHQVTSPSSLNATLKLWYDMVVADSPKTKEALSESDAMWIDVRDTALGHVLALEKDAAGGERILTSNGRYNWQDWLDAANSLSPSPMLSNKLQRGYPEINQVDSKPEYLATIDPSKQARILGTTYRTKLETTKDILEDFARRGW